MFKAHAGRLWFADKKEEYFQANDAPAESHLYIRGTHRPHTLVTQTHTRGNLGTPLHPYTRICNFAAPIATHRILELESTPISD